MSGVKTEWVEITQKIGIPQPPGRETLIYTEAEDKGPKKEVYEKILRAPEYLCYNPYPEELVGWRLQAGYYREIEPDDQGRLWSEELQLWVGTWWGDYLGRAHRWLRFFDPAGRLVLTEREAEAQAHQEAEEKIAALKAKLKKLGHDEE